MDEIYTKIQVYLIKKDKECENLRFLTSRTTPSNAAHVSDVCEAIKNILRDEFMTKPRSEDPKSIQNLKFLLLNTNFKSQEYMCEDLANGHLVDICPPLSPYLFLELVWALGYEDVLCTAILNAPMDLCTEILTVLRRCLDTEFQRAFKTVLKVAKNCYKKLVLALCQDVQALEDGETLKRFMGSVQELVAQLPALQARDIEGLSQLAKHQRCGWALRQILEAIRTCIETRRLGEIQGVEDGELEKLYRLTFGRDFMVRLDSALVSEEVDRFTKQLMDLLLANVKRIDCYVYMGWAEIDCEDGSISMQRDVGLACYHFIEFLGADQELEEYTHVVECLRQLSSKPEAPSSMNLAELCGEIDKGNAECLRKLIERYEEWDSTAISCLGRNRASIEKAECFSLIDSVVKSQEGLCAEVYALAVEILLGQKIVDLVEIVVEFILAHDASRNLESVNFEADLKSYVNQGLALCSNGTSLRVVLFFLIQNPREVIKTLIRTCIGYSEHSNGVMLPEDLCKLSPILKIRDSNDVSLFSNSLKDVCGEDSEWSGKKFVNLIRVGVDKRLTSADEIFNDVFTPILKTKIILPNVRTILISVRAIKDDLTKKFNRTELLYALGLQMANLRKSTEVSFHCREESMSSLAGVIDHFAKARRIPGLESGADSFSQKLEAELEPLDRFYFAPRWSWARNETCLDRILEDYKSRCFRVMNQPDLLTNEDFLQHLILRCTESEHLRFAKEAIIVNSGYFGWKNELEAYEKFSLATITACNYYLESSDLINPSEFTARKVSSMIKNLAKLTTWLISIDVMNDYESVQKILVAAINTLSLSHVVPILSHDYQELKSRLNQSLNTVSSYETVAKLVDSVDKFADGLVLQISNHPLAGVETRSLSVRRFYVNSTLISVCLGWPAEENSLLLSKIDKKLCSV